MQISKHLDPPILNPQSNNPLRNTAAGLWGSWPGNYWYLGTKNFFYGSCIIEHKRHPRPLPMPEAWQCNYQNCLQIATCSEEGRAKSP